jgi:hypothetical protein
MPVHQSQSQVSSKYIAGEHDVCTKYTVCIRLKRGFNAAKKYKYLVISNIPLHQQMKTGKNTLNVVFSRIWVYGSIPAGDFSKPAVCCCQINKTSTF